VRIFASGVRHRLLFVWYARVLCASGRTIILPAKDPLPFSSKIPLKSSLLVQSGTK